MTDSPSPPHLYIALANAIEYHHLGYKDSGAFDANTMVRLMDELRDAYYATPSLPSPAVEIRRNDDGSVDEIVAKGCDVHIEQMDAPHWFMQIGQETFSIWCVRAKGRWSVEISHIETREP